MTCILRAGGPDFDVADFIANSTLVTDSVWHKGAKRFPGSKSSDQLNGSSGMRVVASEADFADLSQQIKDVIVFLRQNQEPIRVLASYPGVESVVLDFGAEIRPPGWASFSFPAELLLLAGSVGVSLCLSVYPSDTEGDADA
jgi:hypothetical protein